MVAVVGVVTLMDGKWRCILWGLLLLDDNYDDGEMAMMMTWTWCGRGSTRSKQRCVEAATKVYRETEESINQTDKAERLEEAKKPH